MPTGASGQASTWYSRPVQKTRERRATCAEALDPKATTSIAVASAMVAKRFMENPVQSARRGAVIVPETSILS